MPARTIAIGDIHGCDVALEVLLRELALTAEDTVIVLGDVVDRGPDTKSCIDRLLELRQTCPLVFLAGNHEEMFLNALSGGEWSRAWLGYGGQEMLDSYGGSFDDIPEEHLEFIRSGRDFYESETEIFAHAALNPAWPLARQNVHFLRWNRLRGTEQPHVSGRRIICGHTAQKSGRPLVFDGWVCLDTCVYGSTGTLTALELPGDLIYQADQRGTFHGTFTLDTF
jgi:Calcineurin-like phosphoesterase